MTFEIVFVLLSLLGMMAALIADKMRPGMVLFSVVVLFLCVGILTGFTELVCIYFAIDIVIIFRIS